MQESIAAMWMDNGRLWRAGGQTRDISEKGVFCYLDAKPLQNSRVEVILELPYKVTGKQSCSVRCQSKVVRVEPQGEGLFGVAIEIESCAYLAPTLRRRATHWFSARAKGIDYVPQPGAVRFGSLRRNTPLSREFGYDRGQPIDRYYIERFLAENASGIRGRVLEIADNYYTRRFGADRVIQSDILHVAEGNLQATIVGDLTRADHIPSASFDCVILTQTLQYIYDVQAAIRTIKRILKPGGTVLGTVPGITQISRYDADRWGCFWSFTSLSVRRLFEAVFPACDITVQAYGNVLAATAFLYGIASEELDRLELEYRDADYEVIITVKAVDSRIRAGKEMLFLN